MRELTAWDDGPTEGCRVTSCLVAAIAVIEKLPKELVAGDIEEGMTVTQSGNVPVRF